MNIMKLIWKMIFASNGSRLKKIHNIIIFINMSHMAHYIMQAHGHIYELKSILYKFHMLEVDSFII